MTSEPGGDHAEPMSRAEKREVIGQTREGKCKMRNAAGSDPIGGVGSGGVAEVCEGNPFFATGETPVVPVVHRMSKGPLMSGFEKSPPLAPNAGKRAGRVRRPMGLLC